MNLKHKNIMKRNMIRAALFAVFAFVAGYGVYTSQKETSMSDLAMANVEALAGGGEVIVGPWYCAGSGYCYDVETHMGFDGTKYYF